MPLHPTMWPSFNQSNVFVCFLQRGGVVHWMKRYQGVFASLCRFSPLAKKNLAEPSSLLMNKRRLREPIGARQPPPTPCVKVIHLNYSHPPSGLCHQKLADLLAKHCKELSNLCPLQSVRNTPTLRARTLHLVGGCVSPMLLPVSQETLLCFPALH